MDRYLVISSDCHAGLPGEQYREYLEPGYRDEFDTFLTERAAMEAEIASRGLRNEEFAEQWFEDNEEGLRGGWDATRRDQELEADGVAGEVIFPDADAVSGGASAPFGAGLGMSSDIPGDLLMAGARAHNRWLAELCSDSPHRRAGIAIVPILDDIEAAVTEIRRARESGLRGGILIPAMWRPYAPYHDPRYEPVWSVCEELEMPVHTHSGSAPKEEFGEHVGLYIAEVRFWATRPLWFLLWSGVFERHPGLRFAVTECGAFWAADLLWTMDIAYDREHASKKLGSQLTATLPRRPSEYFDRNCGIGAANTRRRELARRHEIGVGNIMWGNDFPHPEGTWPHTREFLRDAFWDIPVDDTARILGTNAAEFFGFDTARLRELADRIGPTPAELGQTEADDGRWTELAAAGRPWLTGKEALAVPEG
ncbi:MAG TPA: amidohydrolase family protein [Acidimicrobiia bacterium]|nr:amidohydrolase family protein [Acidimicrobiia bacterium]